ncbi:MAG: 2Fe-2S iron-sulfur cluster-binding protein [Anaeromassilibacillus sp.]
MEKRLRSVENCRPPFSCAKKKCQTCKMEIIDGRTAKDIQCPPRPIRPESQRTSRFWACLPAFLPRFFPVPWHKIQA